MSKTFAVILLVGALPAFAGQSAPAPSPRSNARFGALRPSQDPYKKLFEPRKNVIEPRKAAPSIDLAAPKPRVVCGMTIVPGDPKADPKMAIPRKSDGIDYTIRAIDPPVCNPAR